MTAAALWQQFCAAAGVPESTPHEVWAFCGGEAGADELAQLALAGIKTATASSKRAFDTAGDPLPKPGGYSVILYRDGTAAGVIRDTRVSLVPFDQVSPEHAWREGEGSRTLAEWRQVHRQAFTPDYAAAGLPFDEKGLCVLEEFELVYAATDGETTKGVDIHGI